MDDTVLQRCPLSPEEARALMAQTRLYEILNGARGRKPADIAATAQMLSALSRFAARADSRLASIDLNPVMILDEGQGALALDALIEIETD